MAVAHSVEIWRTILDNLRAAETALAVMADLDASRPSRDAATAAYVRAADAIIADLGFLDRRGVLAAIGEFLGD